MIPTSSSFLLKRRLAFRGSWRSLNSNQGLRNMCLRAGGGVGLSRLGFGFGFGFTGMRREIGRVQTRGILTRSWYKGSEEVIGPPLPPLPLSSVPLHLSPFLPPKRKENWNELNMLIMNEGDKATTSRTNHPRAF